MLIKFCFRFAMKMKSYDLILIDVRLMSVTLESDLNVQRGKTLFFFVFKKNKKTEKNNLSFGIESNFKTDTRSRPNDDKNGINEETQSKT